MYPKSVWSATKTFLQRTIIRQILNYNINERARKEISKVVKTAAPPHKPPSYTVKEMKSSSAYKEMQMKNKNLDEYLKQVQIEKNILKPGNAENRPLPVKRSFYEEEEFGFKEPGVIPKNKTTIRLMLKALGNYQNDKNVYTFERIANDLKLPLEPTALVLLNVRLLEVYKSQKKGKVVYAGPSIPRLKLVKHKGLELESSEQIEIRKMKENAS